MNNMYSYSATTNSFYDNSLRDTYAAAGNWPKDCNEVGDSVFAEFKSDTSSGGKMRVAGADGLPVWVDAPKPSRAQLIEIAADEKNTCMQKATNAIAPLQDAVDLSDATSNEQALLTSWKQYRVALNRIETQATYPETIDWPVAPA